MRENEAKILEAAVQVFMRYGVGRTRMSDIANEAGVVRQTLYSSFKNKDEILCASIRHFSEKSLSDIKSKWASQDRVEDKLETYFEDAIISSYAIITASADARDMIGGYNAAGRAETERAKSEKIAAMSDMLVDSRGTGPKVGIPEKQIAQFIVFSAIGMRDQATSEKQLRALLEVQKQGVLAMLNI